MYNLSESRRGFLKKSALLVSSYPFRNTLSDSLTFAPSNGVNPVELKWLAPFKAGIASGVTCGVCWPQGKVKKGSDFIATDEKQQGLPVQSWPLAYWPDGSLKWTAHTLTTDSTIAKQIFVKPGKSKNLDKKVLVTETSDTIQVDTGKIRCSIARSGSVLIRSIVRQESEIVKDGKLVLLLQDQSDSEESLVIRRENFQGTIADVHIEQAGPLRSVIKFTGIHQSAAGQKQIPFVVRLYFHHNSEAIRVMHTLIYDGEESQHFIKGIGISFGVTLKEELYNHHIRFVNSEHEGVFAEAVQGLTGLRRDPGKAITDAQLNGKAVEPNFPKEVGTRLQYIPAFGDYTLSQGEYNAFSIRKRTSAKHSWITAGHGQKAIGLAYLGTPSGGLAAGIRNFWQSYPAQLDVRDANTETGRLTLWFWAPDAPAMDLRFYHDGMEQDTFAKQREGLEITYEDYEPGFGTAKGVARTSEVMLWVVEATPSRETLLEMADTLQNPPLLVCDPGYLEQLKVFGGNWSRADVSVPAKAALEKQLDYYFNYYVHQVEQHQWYGFWNYGDFMHTYDPDRHTWRYDVGGFAWDNSELSTDLWLWYYFLHTGRADVFRVAEAMTRHTGEVDVHHLGPFAPLGSRHNVMHWGCSAKQLRISTAANRRMYYYLTGDERVGDLLTEQVEAARTLAKIIPGRKLPQGEDVNPTPHPLDSVPVGFGTDWGAIAAAWLTQWERTGDPGIRKRLLTSMRAIAAQPKGFFTGSSWLNVSTGEFTISQDKDISVSHLSAVFGLTEICEELVALVNEPAFTKAWLQYCRLYNASEEEQKSELGQSASKLNLQQGHSRLTAFAASHTQDKTLAARAWKEFYAGKAGIVLGKGKLVTIKGSQVLNPVEEDRTISTNAVAQWGLAAMQCLAYVGQYIPEN
ncbi:Tat pathway signal sequence domain protein [Cytophagaceae bacterium DM2B3-1]|uniref:Tat pathway signal sequence domain protein n=1 Tax=Xanthocytophaga flava TaxID=3048013 RepID=A0ABT7CIU9_9BACT|nr:Tat pathway signal sequence domain protein [Xanthocytophaga flavus]MDJ1493654.1 Tat pathway signal sequence domain protein [Xanthocytophaga flavus]